MKHASLLIVDDEADIRNLVKGILEDEGYRIHSAANSDEAYDCIAEFSPQLIVLDIWLQGSKHDGLQILETVKSQYPDIPVVMISGHGTIETAVSAIKKGAYDFIEKPFKSDRLILMIQRALETAQLRQENERLRRGTVMNEKLIGVSQAMQDLRAVLDRVAPTNSRVLLTGAPGAGKDIAARYLHRQSLRASAPFLVLSCATLRPERLEIELFGSADGVMGEPGHVGVLERAHGGTLLLDEVADLPLETQGKIVRVLQSQSFTKVGDDTPLQVDVRIIASTNSDLQYAIDQGSFRQDLYYRLNVVPIDMPSLRDRVQDIPELVEYFMFSLAREGGTAPRSFSEAALVALQNYDWPGNIRQLRNVVEWVMIMNAHRDDEDAYVVCDLPPEIKGEDEAHSSASQKVGGENSGAVFLKEWAGLPLREAREAFEKEYLSTQIQRFGGNVSKTAQFVGMERSALHRKMKSLAITAPDQDSILSGSDSKIRKRA